MIKCTQKELNTINGGGWLLVSIILFSTYYLFNRKSVVRYLKKWIKK